jgi:translocation protein SEC62
MVDVARGFFLRWELRQQEERATTINICTHLLTHLLTYSLTLLEVIVTYQSPLSTPCPCPPLIHILLLIMSSITLPEVYNTEKGLKKLATYLRSPDGVKVRSAVEHGKRVEYFKGKRLIETLMTPNMKTWPKDLPKIDDKTVAASLAALLLRKSFFHRSEKDEDNKGVLLISQKKVFEDSGLYTWIFSGNMLWSHLFTGLIIGVVIICTLLPVWPFIMKKILWYIAVTFLLVTFVFCTVRLILFLICWVFGYEFWILPRYVLRSLSTCIPVCCYSLPSSDV